MTSEELPPERVAPFLDISAACKPTRDEPEHAAALAMLRMLPTPLRFSCAQHPWRLFCSCTINQRRDAKPKHPAGVLSPGMKRALDRNSPCVKFIDLETGPGTPSYFRGSNRAYVHATVVVCAGLLVFALQRLFSLTILQGA